ncbi:MAG TPA: WG repeat-containing protein [Saprospiraceae bacterium]|nr:WG repeat-containing protein [Saprospiraceae bacterium]
MMRNLFTLLLATCVLQIFGQDVRFPYLMNGKYAISNVDGELLTESIYEDLIIAKGQPYIAVKKDGLWGFLNYKGQTILQPSITIEVRTNLIGLQGPSTLRAGTIYTSDPGNRFLYDRANLFYTFVWPYRYFYNLFTPNESAPPFLDASKINHDSKSRYRDGSFERTGLYKVATLDSKINFLDTTGIPIFKQSVYDGFPVSASVLAIENENKKFALYDRYQSAITAFIYDEIQVEDDGNFIRAHQQNESGLYALYTNKGKLLIDSLSEYPSLNHGMAIIKNRKENTVMLLDTAGKILLSYPNAFLEFNRKRNDQLFYIQQGRYGLIDIDGNFLILPTYSSLTQLENGNYSFIKSNAGGILDTNYIELWRIEGVYVSQGQSGRSDLYNINYQGVYGKHTTGLVDQTGKVIFEPQFKFASFWKGCDLFYTQTDSTIAFYNLKLEVVIPPRPNFKTADCQEGKITFEGSELIEFDLAGKPWVYPKKEIQIQSVDGKKFLLGQGGKPLTKAMYSTLKGFKADSTGQKVFLGLQNENDSFYEIISDQGTSLDLRDYGLPTKDINFPYENGLIIVVNKSEYTKKAGRVKKGVIDFNGQWVIEPDYHQILMVQHELIFVSNPIKESIATYNRHGEKISSKAYIFERRNGNVQPSGRIEVTYGKNEKEYLDFLKQMWSIWRDASTNVSYEPIPADFPEMVYGYIDLNGKEIVETKYKKVSDFHYGYVCVMGEDKAGNPFSALLDQEGKELLKTDFDEISFFDHDSTTFRIKENNLFGAIDIKGNIKLAPTFLKIEKDHEINYLWTAHDAEATYLIGMDFNPVKIGLPGKADLINIPGNYFCLQINNIDQSSQDPLKNIFYNSQGKMLSQYDNAYLASNKFGKYDIPDGFVLMVEKNSKLPFVFNITNGKAYRK